MIQEIIFHGYSYLLFPMTEWHIPRSHIIRHQRVTFTEAKVTIFSFRHSSRLRKRSDSLGDWDGIHPDSTLEKLVPAGPLHVITVLTMTITVVPKPHRDALSVIPNPFPTPAWMVKQEPLLRPMFISKWISSNRCRRRRYIGPYFGASLLWRLSEPLKFFFDY